MKIISEDPNKFDIYNTPPKPTDGHYMWGDKNSITFIVDRKIEQAYIINGGGTHMDILDYQIFNGEEIEDDEDNEWERKNAFHGRIWTIPKVISFWQQPNPHQLKAIIDLLNQSYPDVMSNIDIINDYVIETSYDKQSQKSTFVTVKDYINGNDEKIENNFDQSIVHKTPGLTTKEMEAYKDSVYNNRDKKLGNISSAEYNHYRRYGMGESMINNKGINLQLENKKIKNTNKIINIIENIINDVKSEDLNLNSFKPKEELNPKFWINNKLNSRVRLRLLDIADDFFNDLSINWVKPKDIVFTGSLANYNWSKYSDIDVHILIDYDEIYKKHDFVEDYFKTKKDLWLEEHPNLKIYGFPVELYVEDINSKGVSSGVYSLEKNEWIIEPGNFQDVHLNEKYIKQKAAHLMTAIDDIGEKLKKETDSHKIEIHRNSLHKIFDKIKNIRKEGLKNEGEMSSGNIIFKILRRTNYFDKLWDLMNTSYDKINSIKENKLIKKTIIITENQFKILKEKGL